MYCNIATSCNKNSHKYHKAKINILTVTGQNVNLGSTGLTLPNALPKRLYLGFLSKYEFRQKVFC